MGEEWHLRVGAPVVLGGGRAAVRQRCSSVAPVVLGGVAAAVLRSGGFGRINGDGRIGGGAPERRATSSGGRRDDQWAR
jgi:hypothetical protein